MKDELGANLFIAQLDVRNRAAIEEMLESLPPEFRDIDILVNNAGLALGLEPAHKANVEDWETMIDTNNKGLIYMTRAVLPGMVERNRGILLISVPRQVAGPMLVATSMAPQKRLSVSSV